MWRRWRRRWATWLSGTRACARSSRNGLGCRGRTYSGAAAARIGLEVSRASEEELAAALSGVRPGRDLICRGRSRLRAHLFELGASEHVLLLVLHHIAGDGWSLAPLWRDLGRPMRRALAGRAPQLPALPVQYADYTLWQHEVLGERERCGERDLAPACVSGRETLAGLPDQLELPTDRPRPAVSSHRGGEHAGCTSGRSCTAGCWGWRGRAGRACSWCCRPGLRRC